MKRMRIDIVSHFECRGSRSKDIVWWMEERCFLWSYIGNFTSRVSRGKLDGEVCEMRVYF